MSNFWQKKITKHSKQQEKPQSEETKQESEPDSDITEILELSDQEFKITDSYANSSNGKKWTTCKNKWVT